MIELRVAEDPAGAAAELVCDAVAAALDARAAAHVALAGGSTPRRAYEALAGRLGDGAGLSLWFGDERAVRAGDPDSNFRMVSETLLADGALPGARVHRVRGELGARAAARGYALELAQGLPDGRLDLALLGLGEDGHTASLFPGHPALDADALAVAVLDAPKPPPERVTLTLPVLRAARSRLVLATGAGKADAVVAVLRGPDRAVPASLLGEDGDTVLLVDPDAASRVSPPR